MHFETNCSGESVTCKVDRQIRVMDFKYMGNICPYTYVTRYCACAVSSNALSRVACERRHNSSR